MICLAWSVLEGIVAYSLEFRLIKAAKNVGEMHPYYSPAVERVRFKQDSKDTPTMSIDCSLVVHFNKSFTNKISNQELESIVLHEILHYVNGHHARYMNSPLRKTLPFALHNIAMDIEINEFIPNLPTYCFKAKDFGLPDRKSYEEYLGILNRDMPPKLKALLDSPCLSCKNGCNNPRKNKKKGKKKEEQDGEDNDETGDQTDDPCEDCPHQGKGMLFDDLNMDGYNEIYQAVLDDLIRECEKSRGTEMGSGDMIRKVKKRKYPWEQVFQNIITAKVTEIVAGFKYRTFEKPNRRYIHTPDIIFPRLIKKKKKISLAIVMDVSGSMGENVNKMYGVMKSMLDILDLEIDITVLEVAMSVENVMHGFDLTRESIKSKDGGGTDMGAGLYYIEENKIETDLIIVMTDSYTPWPDPPILADKMVVLTDNPDDYDGPYPVVYPVVFDS
jgi:predicted metal-dependent peptidase